MVASLSTRHASAAASAPDATGDRARAGLALAPSTQLRLWWGTVAAVTGWLAATLITVGGVVVGLLPATQVTASVLAITAPLAVVLYRRFARLRRIDEAVVLVVVVGWTVVLGLLSL